ncbi:undecaprenyl-diphosphate phosphatase [Brytella acorum]|uniref:Undecaprenyl-diphosphatase n=1 Tax=Brytella acorum TaxID=2959299 RepID=A0AA35ULK5_9PROT|nr:undecaprenyl-diphosphate phosphatase [Brytella acorum]MDF3624472.1 undecaprenyl-diphosphate phosphatase [Brytella acorum]CAI9119678.1 undecaprenyl-diphosphate phosphatase [Brytella acorum]
MTLAQALFLAVLQGVTELFPISSLGHAVLIPALLHWHIDENDPLFLPFLTMLHFGTLVALLLVFASDWIAIIGGALGRHGQARREQSIRILVLLVVGTLPLVVVGGVFEHRLRSFFGAPLIVAVFLMVNGFLLFATEWLRSLKGRQPQRAISDMSAGDALTIGLWQCLALFPGISRSGVTMNGGLLRGLDHETAAKFSFLLAQPAILAATVHQAFKLRHVTIPHDVMIQSCLAAIVAGVTAVISTLTLLRYFRGHDRWALTPFAFYCLGAGFISIVLLVF